MLLYINATAVVVIAVDMLIYSSEYDVDGKLWARHLRKKTKMLLESAKASRRDGEATRHELRE
jgi:hypothetical protein